MNKKDIEMLAEAYVGNTNLRDMSNIQSDELEAPEQTSEYDNLLVMMKAIDDGYDVREWKVNPFSGERISPEEISTAYSKIQTRDISQVR